MTGRRDAVEGTGGHINSDVNAIVILDSDGTLFIHGKPLPVFILFLCGYADVSVERSCVFVHNHFHLIFMYLKV